MNIRSKLTVVAALTLLPSAVVAQNPATQSLRGLFDVTRQHITATAEMVDEELYAFRPTDEVRSLGEILAHVANAQFAFCSAAAGEQSPNSENFEQTRTTKAQIVAALDQGFSYCAGVFDGTTDSEGGNAVNLFGGSNTVFGVLAFNSAHNYEHYGNLVTYMRINGITPPSSMQ